MYQHSAMKLRCVGKIWLYCICRCLLHFIVIEIVYFNVSTLFSKAQSLSYNNRCYLHSIYGRWRSKTFGMKKCICSVWYAVFSIDWMFQTHSTYILIERTYIRWESRFQKKERNTRCVETDAPYYRDNLQWGNMLVKIIFMFLISRI